MNRTQASHLRRAFRIASESTCRQKHGVVIAIGARVIAVAVNTDRNHPNICSNPKDEASFHAERNALRQLEGRDLKDAVLYSARVGKLGKALCARPCPSCRKLMSEAGIKKYYHT